MIPKKAFYFIRHGETDHNIHKIYDDLSEVHLNDNGAKQALEVQKIMQSIPIATVCSSPLLRAQQTKKLVLGKRQAADIIVDEFKECASSLWRLFLALESRELQKEEWELIHQFTQCIKQGLIKALSYDSPMLIVAHGGTYWAIAYLLQLQGDRKIGNCVPACISPDALGNWKAETIK